VELEFVGGLPFLCLYLAVVAVAAEDVAVGGDDDDDDDDDDVDETDDAEEEDGGGVLRSTRLLRPTLLRARLTYMYVCVYVFFFSIFFNAQ
jgi:hypothetical protein